jgi:hypothetical protein
MRQAIRHHDLRFPDFCYSTANGRDQALSDPATPAGPGWFGQSVLASDVA